MLIIGITGGIATGKSKACRYIRDKHAVPLIDSDRICHELMSVHGPAYSAIVSAFGEALPDLLSASTGEIDRQVLGHYVFTDKRAGGSDGAAKRKLESILHPLVKRHILWSVAGHFLKGAPVVVLELPLLFEARLERYMSQSVVVSCSEKVQLQRLHGRNPELTLPECLFRIHAQLSLEDKCKLADVVVDNSQSWANTQSQLDVLVATWERAKWRQYIYIGSFYVLSILGVYVACVPMLSVMKR